MSVVSEGVAMHTQKRVTGYPVLRSVQTVVP